MTVEPVVPTLGTDILTAVPTLRDGLQSCPTKATSYYNLKNRIFKFAINADSSTA